MFTQSNVVVDPTPDELVRVYRSWEQILAGAKSGVLPYDWVASQLELIVQGPKTADVVQKPAADVAPAACMIFTIDRSQPFNPADVFGKGWTMWKGPADGTGLDGEEEWDERSRALTQFDPAKIVLEHCLKEGENSIKGEEKLKRLREEFTALIRLDPQLGYALVQEPGQRTLEWLRINRGLTWMDLPGGVLRNPYGNRYFLCVYFDGERWSCHFHWLESDWNRQYRSGLLASSDLKA
ncbi:MAG: hypothetical protein HYZ63_01505 [Candidatus Andersenbacteria bacterium]|nr:hypothetical protein [Candidatus Andersenbacteria bacterium]